MKLHRLLIVVVCAASLCVAASAQERPAVIPHVAGIQPFQAGIAGTCTNKDDFSFTGTPAGLAPGLSLRVYCVVAGAPAGYYSVSAAVHAGTGACLGAGGEFAIANSAARTTSI